MTHARIGASVFSSTIALRSLILPSLPLFLGLVAGCPGVVVVVVDGNQDPTLTSPLGKSSGEPNDSFADAVVAVFDPDGRAELQGTVALRGDLDVFLLGALATGDRVRVSAFAGQSPLDASIALFDSEERLTLANDDRCEDLDDPACLDPALDFVVRHDSSNYFLVVTNSAFASRGQGEGTYKVDIRMTSGANVPPLVPQTILLDFDGADVDAPGIGAFALDSFNAARIDPAYAGDTDEMKEIIRDTFAKDYERFNVTVLTTDDPPPASNSKFSVVFFGGFDPTAFGLAEAVDVYNVDRCDDAVIFTESFSVSAFSNVPSTEQMAKAIGNVAAHEAGHLLGLNHVNDDLDIMDDRSPADAFIADQEFKNSILSTDIMSIGTQDSVLLLNEIVGPAAAP